MAFNFRQFPVDTSWSTQPVPVQSPVAGPIETGQSGTAQATQQPSGPPPAPANQNDPAALRQWVIDTANFYGQPQIAASPDYWVGQIQKVGGVGDGQYWGQWISSGGRNPAGSEGGGGGTLGDLSAPLLRGYGTPYVAPTADEVMNSPAVQARLKAGEEAIHRSRSASGTLNTGGLPKDLTTFASDLASQEYNNENSRRLQAAGFNRDTIYGDTDRQFSRLADFTQLGMQGSSQLGQYTGNYGQNTNVNAGQQVNLATGQTDNDANTILAGGALQQGTLANLVNNVGSIDWSRLWRTQNQRTPTGSSGY